jgi:hypothetical protein
LLHGYGDPLWSTETRKRIYESQTARSTKHRAKRFLELLKTVDGIFVQRYMSVPEEKWTWHTYDLFTLKNLSSLIGDEFFDGEVRVAYHDMLTRYSQLKKLRKRFKDLSNRNQLESFLSDKARILESVPRWLNDWLPVWKYTRRFEKPFALAQVDGLLSQTRAAGTPPDLVKMQSKRGFIETVSKEPPPLTPTEKSLIRAAISSFDEMLDPGVFTGLDTKARVTLTISSCWEKTQEEGGTIQAISEITHMGAIGKKVPRRNLFTGEKDGEVEYSHTDSGTYIFWACLDEVLKCDPGEITMAALVMVSEPGKARTVTKATAALKVVLDVVNKICSWPLTKIESSSSGMAKSSHAWNSFKKSFTDSGKDVSFNPQKVEIETGPDGEKVKTTTYRDVFMSSTDYSNATDAMVHEVASMLSRYWMKKCGIPPILQMIVLRTCYTPRPIVFEARGPMASYGEPWEKSSPFDNPHFVMLRRGVLMGDPLTKPVLHLVNILVRTMGEKFSDPDFQGKVFGYSGKAISDEIRLRMQGEKTSMQVRAVFSDSSDLEMPIPPEAGPSTSDVGPMAALLDQYPVDPTIVDPVMELPEVTGPNSLKYSGSKVIEFDPRLTWNWLKAKERERTLVPVASNSPVREEFSRTVSFNHPQVREALSAEFNSARTAELLRQDRLTRQRYVETFRNIQIIPRTSPVARHSGYQEFRARSTSNYRAASATSIHSSLDKGETPGCTKALLRVFGILS